MPAEILDKPQPTPHPDQPSKPGQIARAESRRLEESRNRSNWTMPDDPMYDSCFDDLNVILSQPISEPDPALRSRCSTETDCTRLDEATGSASKTGKQPGPPSLQTIGPAGGPTPSPSGVLIRWHIVGRDVRRSGDARVASQRAGVVSASRTTISSPNPASLVFSAPELLERVTLARSGCSGPVARPPPSQPRTTPVKPSAESNAELIGAHTVRPLPPIPAENHDEPAARPFGSASSKSLPRRSSAPPWSSFARSSPPTIGVRIPTRWSLRLKFTNISKRPCLRSARSSPHSRSDLAAGSLLHRHLGRTDHQPLSSGRRQ